MQAQNVGIGTNQPMARLHVYDSNVIFTGPQWYLPNPATNTPVSGEGTRLMWYASKAAFRVGGVSDNLWDKDSIGKFSIAAGLDVMAKGDYSIAMGVNNNANNWYGIAMGAGNKALYVSGIAMGYNNIAVNTGSVAIGSNLITKSVYAISLGHDNDTMDVQQPTGNSSQEDRLFQIGNGTSFSKNNAITILRNGNTGLGVANPVARLQTINGNILFAGGLWNLPNTPGELPLSGAGSSAFWYADKAAFRTGAVSGNS